MSQEHPQTSQHRSYFKDLSIVLSAYIVAGISTYLAYTYFVNSLGKDSLIQSIILDIFATSVVFLFSLAAGNTSVYDIYWGVATIPLATFWIKNTTQDLFSTKNVFFLILLAIYTFRHVRLYFSHWTGLQYEDFRYVDMKKKVNNNPWLFWILSFISLHMIPTLFVLTAMIPVYDGVIATEITSSWIFFLGVVISIGGIAIEDIADYQLHKWRKTCRPDAFIDVGLWRYSRHPNYFGEIAFWVGLYAMDLGTNGTISWTWVGPLSIFLLFEGVTISMMEGHLLKKRPTYAIQQKRVSRLMFWFRNEKAAGEHEALLQNKTR